MSQTSLSLTVSLKEHFAEALDAALERRQVKTLPLVKLYLVEILERHAMVEALFDELDEAGRRSRSTLAETFLKAQTADGAVRHDMLRRLADRTLYITGFFADSLQRKLVDIDYYVDVGGTAYRALAEESREDVKGRVFLELGRRFTEFVDVISAVSLKAKMTDEENILRLYEVYNLTGSESAREQLLSRGLLAPVRGSVGKQQ
jgi:hypothetical protein